MVGRVSAWWVWWYSFHLSMDDGTGEVGVAIGLWVVWYGMGKLGGVFCEA